MEKTKIILDCDPGHDDAVAILMAAIHPKIELLGITVVAGNQTLEKTSKNALNVCEYLNINVPVCSGMDRPMIKEKQTIADDIHGESGLDGPIFRTQKKELDKIHAIDFIIDTVEKYPNEITLVPTGPLSNVAMALRRKPSIAKKIKEIVLMGGCYQLGNVTPAAEFNIFADADAAYVVFTSGIPIVMMGLDVTRQVLCYPTIIERMEKINNSASKLFTDLMKFFCKTQKQVFGWEGGPLHDPTCIAYLIDKTVVETKHIFTEIEIRSDRCYGRTLCDYFGVTENKPNSNVAVKIDAEKFWNIVEECINLYKN